MIDKQQHYSANKEFEPIKIMKGTFSSEQYIGFLKGNVLKYIMRFERKNGVEDLDKALTYLTWLREEYERKEKM